MEEHQNKDFCFDFHIHSRFSYDSLLSLKRIIRIAERRGLDGVAITDHETIKGALEASKFKKTPFVIIGSEIKTEEGDIIGLFLTEEITSRYFDDVVNEIKSQNGLVVLPHPYKKNQTIKTEMLSKVDMIETFNGKLSSELNYKAQILAQTTGKPMIGGSDAHLSRSIGSVKTLLSCEPNMIQNTEDIKRFLMKGNVKVVGRESPRYVHYHSALIGNIRKGNIQRLGKLSLSELRSVLNRKYE